MNQKLFVIGNGFDLHHGIPSRFSDFGKYVEDVAPDLCKLMNDYLFVDEDFWNCFEARLATFDSSNVIEYADQFLIPYSSNDWSDAYHHDFEYEIEKIVSNLSSGLHGHFCEWVRNLPILQKGSAPIVKCLDPDSRFISFNYTSTLQDVYKVPENNVLHIHGRVKDQDSSIVLGHGWKRRTEDTLFEQADEDTDARIAGGYRLIDQYFIDTFKPTEKLIHQHHAQFEGLSDVNEVVVLGHSLADVDAPYFHEIIKCVQPSTNWTVSCYREPSLEQARLKSLGVPSHHAHFAPLSIL